MVGIRGVSGIVPHRGGIVTTPHICHKQKKGEEIHSGLGEGGKVDNRGDEK